LTPKAEHAVEAIAQTPEIARPFGEILAIRLRCSETREQARAPRAEAKLARATREHDELHPSGGPSRARDNDLATVIARHEPVITTGGPSSPVAST
jgi:hypothetical protein